MSWKIELGLFALGFTDHHAILGIPVDIEFKDIRKPYLQIARKLHPDSGLAKNDGDRKRAAEYLSKLVNPAYEKLSSEETYKEYSLLLKLQGQKAQKQQETVILVSEAARRLASTSLSDLEHCYKAAVQELARKQYDLLDQTLDLTGHLSELNLVYLMRNEVKQTVPVAKPMGAAPAASGAPRTPPPPAPPKPTKSIVDRYLDRAAEFEKKQDYATAIKELREAAQIEATNSAVHAQLGRVYLKNNQATMAKIHFNKALELNPQNPIALEGKAALEGASAAKSNVAKKPDPKAGKPDPKGNKPNNSGGGLFGLFGGKKK